MNPILREYDLKTKLIFIAFYWFARLLHATYRYRIFGADHRTQAASAHDQGAFAFATWHGNSFAGTIAHTYQKFSPLCSRSKDGSMVAYLCSNMGLKPARGSSSRGGKAARTELLENMKEGWSTAITVDGPKGPPHISKPGIIAIAKDAGCEIVPLLAIGERNWQLRSWDRLRIPKPFSRVAVIYAEPIAVPKDCQGEVFEGFQNQVTQELMKLESSYEEYFANWGSGRPLSTFRLEI